MALETLDPNAQNQNATVTVQGVDASQTGTQGALDTVAPVRTGATDAISKWYQDTLGREADIGGLNYWSGQFGETLDPNELAICCLLGEVKGIVKHFISIRSATPIYPE